MQVLPSWNKLPAIELSFTPSSPRLKIMNMKTFVSGREALSFDLVMAAYVSLTF
jgi:hypothetical protein